MGVVLVSGYRLYSCRVRFASPQRNTYAHATVTRSRHVRARAHTHARAHTRAHARTHASAHTRAYTRVRALAGSQVRPARLVDRDVARSATDASAGHRHPKGVSRLLRQVAHAILTTLAYVLAGVDSRFTHSAVIRCNV
eukprot:5775978-Pleurochrysis_carterae.AAC.3